MHVHHSFIFPFFFVAQRCRSQIARALPASRGGCAACATAQSHPGRTTAPCATAASWYEGNILFFFFFFVTTLTWLHFHHFSTSPQMMDHHWFESPRISFLFGPNTFSPAPSPWVNNCVGAGNRKFFVLFVFYMACACFYAIGLVVHRFMRCILSSEGEFLKA